MELLLLIRSGLPRLGVGSKKKTVTELFVADEFEMFDSMLLSADKTKYSMFYGMPKAVTIIDREFLKNIYFCCIDYTKDFDCVGHNKLENSSRDGNTRPPDLPPEKSACKSGSNS